MINNSVIDFGQEGKGKTVLSFKLKVLSFKLKAESQQSRTPN
jgi:hypothetical protein